MPMITIDLDNDESMIVEIFKKIHSLTTKEEAIKRIIRTMLNDRGVKQFLHDLQKGGEKKQ